jgi:protoporphyrinogen/coproporphyrinogen III oxidase
MRVAIVGGGIAGLGAAYRLREAGREVVLLEKEDEPGGRCRSLLWNDQWIVRGAFAFIGSESNLVELSKKLDIYDDSSIVDMTPWHRWNVLVKRKKVARFEEFNLLDAAKHPSIPIGEKAKLLAAIPTMVKSALACDPYDITSSVEFDNVNACEYFRRFSPTFVDYFLEPCLGLFCGYGANDFSLAWTLWGASGRHPWANHWWSFANRGVGQLTWSLGEALARDPGVDYRLSQTVRAVHLRASGVSIDIQGVNGAQETVAADAVVIATPGTKVSGLMPDLDPQRRAFFDQVTYSGHHILYYLLDQSQGDLPANYVLPAADGFDRSANFSFTDVGDGRTLAFSEWKDVGCRRHADCTDEQLLDIGWSDFVDVIPSLASTRIIDRFVSRQPEAIAKRPKGYISEIKKFEELGPLSRATFCGDYLSNSTVGSAHRTGVAAAEHFIV